LAVAAARPVLTQEETQYLLLRAIRTQSLLELLRLVRIPALQQIFNR